MVASKGTQKTVLELIRAGKKTRSAEIIPPRNGTETEVVLRQIDALREVPVDFISVTKGAGGSLRGGTLPIAEMIKSRFDMCALAHFTCRDYTIEEVENSLMDHHYFGVNNILALRGDPPDGEADYFKPAPNRHSYAWQLVDQIRKLNEGHYIVREGFDTPGKTRRGTPTRFCIGVAAHPELEPLQDSIKYLRRKVEVGGQFAITQMLFMAEPYARFLDGCARAGVNIPIIPGIRIVTQAGTAHRMTEKFGSKIPRPFVDKLAAATTKEDGRMIGLDYARDLCEKLFAAGAPGIHVFIMNDEKTATTLLRGIPC